MDKKKSLQAETAGILSAFEDRIVKSACICEILVCYYINEATEMNKCEKMKIFRHICKAVFAILWMREKVEQGGDWRAKVDKNRIKRYTEIVELGKKLEFIEMRSVINYE